MTRNSELYKKLLDGLNSSVLLIDDVFRVRYMNSAAETQFGVSFTRTLGRDVRTFLVSDKDDLDALTAALREAVPFTKRRARIRREHGSEAFIDYSAAPLDLDGQRFLLLEIQDVDRLLRINREAFLINTHDTTRQLVRGLAHEIKNPLGGIKGAAQLLDIELDDPGLKEYTSVITDEVDRLRNLVDRMLGPNKPPAKEFINIHEVVERVVKLLKAEVAGEMKICKDYDPSLPDIWADPEMILQALLNISRNAMQALQESNQEDPKIKFYTRIERRVPISGVTHRLVCRISIVDNGPGIEETRLDEIFYPMITGRSEGTGLGLSIAQSVVQEHGGIIECDSEPGNTRFSILLPLQKVRK